jgi:hypothetical protein
VGWLRISIGRLRQGRLLVVESTAAATVAWLVDPRFIGRLAELGGVAEP